ncbi:MAG: hypothetical protein P8178_13430 [Candidatus Thiodiazotropha sp.]
MKQTRKITVSTAKKMAGCGHAWFGVGAVRQENALMEPIDSRIAFMSERENWHK